MKKLLLISIGAFFVLTSKAQTLDYSSTKDIKLKSETTIDVSGTTTPQTISLTFKILGIQKGQTLTLSAVDGKDGTATITTDYIYTTTLSPLQVSYTPSSNPTTGNFTISINKITTKKLNAVFTITMTDQKKLNSSYKVTVNFNSADDNTFTSNNIANMTAPDTAKWYLRLVTGGNFDFFNGPTIQNFAGDLTAFLPNVIHIGKVYFGFDFGINNFHYYTTDSSHTVSSSDAYFLNSNNYYSNDTSSKVVSRTSNFNRKYDYNVWGIHLDPIYLWAQNDFAQLYARIHLEELTTTETYTPTVANTVNDTISYAQYKKAYPTSPSPTAHPAVLYQYNQHTYYDMYYGAGITTVVNIKNIASLSICPSAGVADIELADPNFDPDPTQRPAYSTGLKPAHHNAKFYTLNKFQLITTVAPVDIAIGGEYRTVASSMHYFNTYIGATITLDKLKK